MSKDYIYPCPFCTCWYENSHQLEYHLNREHRKQVVEDMAEKAKVKRPSV